jgi:hypothetical protein
MSASLPNTQGIRHLILIPVVLLLIALSAACQDAEPIDLETDDPAATEAVEEAEPEDTDLGGELIVETVEVDPNEVVEVVEPDAGDIVYCADAAPAPAEEWFVGTAFDLEVTDDVVVFSTELPEQLPADGLFFTGVDFRALNGPQTGPVPGFALGQGMTYGVSTGFQGDTVLDISVARAGENGELLPWTTAATVEIVDGIVIIEIPIIEISGEVEMLRFTFSDQVICELSGIFEIDNGYERPSAMRLPTLDAWNVDYEYDKICFPDACVSLPSEAAWSPTGENTGEVFVGEQPFVLQFYQRQGSPNDVVTFFENGNWTVAAGDEYGTALGIWQWFYLQSAGGTFGGLAVHGNGNNDDPQTSVIAVTGQNALSEADMEALTSFLTQTMDSFRAGL